MTQTTLPITFVQGGISHGLLVQKQALPASTSKSESIINSILMKRKNMGLIFFDIARLAVLDMSKLKSGVVYCKFYQNDLSGTHVAKQKVSCGNIIFAICLYSLKKRIEKYPELKQIDRITIIDLNTSMKILASLASIVNKNLLINNNIRLAFSNYYATKTRAILPSGRTIDKVLGIQVSCIDAAMPMILLNASSLNLLGSESPQALTKNLALITKILEIRRVAAKLMGIAITENSIIPKVCLISPSSKQSNIQMRYFSPAKCHPSFSITASICLATACMITGTIANKLIIASKKPIKKIKSTYIVNIEHPTGNIDVALSPSENNAQMTATVKGSASIIFDGNLYLKQSQPQTSRFFTQTTKKPNNPSIAARINVPRL